MINANSPSIKKKLKDPAPIFAHDYPTEKHFYKSMCCRIQNDVDISERKLSFDAGYMKTQRGLLKIAEIVASFIAMLMTGSCFEFEVESIVSLVVTFSAFLINFVILAANIFAVNTKIDAFRWFIIEVTYYVIETTALLTAAILMSIRCVSYWRSSDHQLQLIPSVTMASLYLCTALYAVELGIQMAQWRRWSWNPAPVPPPSMKPNTATDQFPNQ
uniref:MARVEL domain-containing protein n=1 Tax=Syphacia muris TaxID=451379 RepID=A0A0N5AVF1_9BILA